MKTTLQIQNLKCGGCAHTIITKLSELDAIENVEVNVGNSSVVFKYENDEAFVSLKKKLTTLGYPEDGEKNSIVSKAKSYVSCATGKMSI